ncbi:MAG: polysaccharide biosynthesis protein [Asgard group archaeon]|nr:polysaccharide biosynthesis protein [Asgard group archaeon]
MESKINVAITGAGIAGELLLKELRNPRFRKYSIIGFIDDDENKIRKKVMGVEVIGSTEEIPEITEKFEIDLYIIAIPSATGKTIKRIVDIIKTTKSNFMIVPPIFQNLQINQIAYPRNVDINDLLRRPIDNVLTKDSMKQLRNSKILITGVAGSIGSELCIQLASCFPKEIIGIDIAETPLYNLANRIKEEFPKINFIPIIGNVQNKSKIEQLISEYKSEIIYHCAAFKHVGLMEHFPHECVRNNVMGSLNVIKAAQANEVGRFVFVSTDKAVYPKGVMGASKRIIEKYILALEVNKSKFMIVRFGNVLESNGSAIEIFKEQIQKGGPVTITDRKMERYFMTIIEAAQLVIQASILGEAGDLMILDMGEPYKIIDIIHQLIELHGFEIDTIPIKEIGKRKGEKITEELFYSFENPKHLAHERILKCHANSIQKAKSFISEVEKLTLNCDSFTKDDLIKRMFKLIK